MVCESSWCKVLIHIQGTRGSHPWGPHHLDQVLLLFFSAGDGFLDCFGFPQYSLGLIQFVATLSIGHFLVNPRGQETSVIRRKRMTKVRALSSLPSPSCTAVPRPCWGWGVVTEGPCQTADVCDCRMEKHWALLSMNS